MTATSAQPLASPPLSSPRCAKHPDKVAQDTCSRCGNFYCADERVLVGMKAFCESCGALPEVNYLEQFRLERWGKRDGWAYLIGVSALAQLALAFQFIRIDDPLSAGISVIAAANAVCYFLGLPFARYSLIGVNVAMLIFNTVEDPNGWTRSILPIAVSIAIFNDTRNQLFFKVPVPQDKLKKAWDLYANNTMARRGFFLGMFGMLIPPLAVVGLICSVIGLRRVNPDAHPPIGRKGMAIAGIAMSSIGVIWGVGVLVASIAKGA